MHAGPEVHENPKKMQHNTSCSSNYFLIQFLADWQSLCRGAMAPICSRVLSDLQQPEGGCVLLDRSSEDRTAILGPGGPIGHSSSGRLPLTAGEFQDPLSSECGRRWS